MRENKFINILKSVRFIPAIAWLLITCAPFVFMLFGTFKDTSELYTNGVFSLPESINFENYAEVIKGSFLTYLLNSIMVVGVSLLIVLAVSAFAAYPLSRFRLAFNKKAFVLIVAAMAIPVHVTLIPVFLVIQKVHLYDSIWALVGPYTAFNLPISIFILTSFMEEIPGELEQAAEIDGCSRYRIFFEVILPLTKPGLATLAIYNGVNMWNEFIFALVLTQSVDSRTLPLSIWDYQGQYASDMPMIMTVLTLSTLPMIICYIVGQDFLIKGMMAGAVKG